MKTGGHIQIPDSQLFETKPFPLSYPKEVISSLVVIANNAEDIQPYGSFMYRAQPFPGDVDLLEPEIFSCKGVCDEVTASKNAAKIFQGIVRRIHKTCGVFLGDVKLGDDVDILDVVRTAYPWGVHLADTLPSDRDLSKVQLQQFSPDGILNVMRALVSKSWVPQDKMEEVRKILQSHDPVFTKHCKIREVLRKLVVLRWTFEEVDRGYKILPGNRKYTLQEAMAFNMSFPHYSNVGHNVPAAPRYGKVVPPLPLAKIDMWTLVGGRFTEITNLTTFVFRGPYVPNPAKSSHRGETEIRELTYGHSNLVEELKVEVAKYYWNPVADKPMKYAKRIFSLARLMKDYKVGRILAEFFRTDINRLNMINAYVDTLQNMIKLNKNSPIDKLKENADSLKPELAKISQFTVPDEYYKMLDQVASPKTSKEKMWELLEKIHEAFKEQVDERTRRYLIRHSLYPAPEKYLDDEFFVTTYS